MGKRPARAFAAALGWLAMATSWTAATAAFTVRFGATGGLEIPLDGAAGAVLQLGQRADALPGEDSHDVLAAPPPPGGGVPLLYFSAFEPLIGQFWHDFQPQAPNQTWELNLVGMTAGTSVTLRWQVEDGSLGARPLKPIDRESQAVLVADMAITTQLLCQDADRVLLVVYGDDNSPPLARSDRAFMLESDGSLSIPFADVLANDDDVDGDLLDVVRLGPPTLPGGGTPDPGSTGYGTTALDPGARGITYTLPAVLPADWSGVVAFEYTVRDNGSPSPAESTAVVLLTVTPHVVQTPAQGRLETQAGNAVTLTYTIRYAGAIQALLLEYSLPLVGSGAALGFWPFLGGYSDDAPGSAPLIDPGYGPDGTAGTGDDTGVVRLDFGTNVPPSGTRLTFTVGCPAGATAAATVQAQARFRLSGGRGAALCQRLGDVSVVAMRYVPEFVAGPGGAVTVEQDENGTTATARPDAGYRFVQWTQGGTQYSAANPLTVTDIPSALTLTARFEPLSTIPPSGDFLASIGASAVTTGGGFWNLTGAYSTLAHGAPLTLLMAHDARGRLTGTASYHAGALEDPPLVMPIRGTVRGTRRTVVLTFASRGSAAGKGVSVELAFSLAVDPVNRRLTGPMTGAVTTAGVKHLISAVESPQTWNIAAPMDGTWSLMFADLSPGPASAVSGTALLTLSSGDAWHFRAKGRLGRDGLTSLVLSGLPGDLEASAIAISLRIRTLEGTPECGIAELVSCRGWGYGQTPTW